MGAELTTRAARRGDMEFLFRLLEVALGPYVEQVYGAWNEEEQRERFFETTDPETHEIVEWEGVEIGCLKVAVRAEEIALHRVFLLPAHQNRGIGTRLVRGILAEGERQRLPVRLRVFHVNPAKRFYRRLGFVVTGETETHLLMEKGPT